MNHLTSGMIYNDENRLETVAVNANDAGQRVRKTVINTGSSIEESRKYIGNWEVYTKFVSSSLTIERETLHIADDTGRIALIDTPLTTDDIDDIQLIRYQYSNHLGSATLELASNGDIISYEEYYPYGSTSFQSGRSMAEVKLKRYRYTGKERDEESGLYYHGARYYIPWLCRWSAVDPMESKYAGMSGYNYCFNNPVIGNDMNGRDPDEEKKKLKTIFISNKTGEILGELEGFEEPKGGEVTDATSGLSIRSIADDDFNYLSQQKASTGEIPESEGSSNMISYLKNSKIVKLDNDKIMKDISEIIKDKYVPGKGVIERSLLIVFDRNNNTLTSYIPDDSKNLNRKTIQDLRSSNVGKYVYFTPPGRNDLIVMASIHTHPLLNGNKRNELKRGSVISNATENETGMSGPDMAGVITHLFNEYAIETYDEINYISKATPSEKLKKGKPTGEIVAKEFIDFEKLSNILSGKFNIIIDAFNAYAQWKK